MKKFMAVFLAIVLILTNPISASIDYADATVKGVNAGTVDNGEVAVKGTNSFGNMIADALAVKADEQESNEGCNLFSIEMKGKEAVVSFEANQEAVVVVGIYEDNGIKMIASGKAEVSKEDTKTIVPIEIDTMPATFYLRGFLIEPDSLRPLCSIYESPNYTKDMQDFFTKTTDDFPADRVLDLDGDKTNNFAVYSDKVTVISGAGIELKSTDEENHIYVFENADSIAALQQGTLFAYPCKDGNVILVKVDEIQTQGNMVTVTGMDASLEDAFTYVKIDTKSDISDIEVDPSGCDEGVKYNGIVQDAGQKPHLSAFEGDETVSKSLSYEFLKEEDKDETEEGDKKRGIYGDVHFNVSASIKVYISTKRQYLEIKLDYEIGPNIKITMENEAKVRLGYLKIFPLPGVDIELKPSFIVKASASVSIAGSLNGTFGFAAENGKGIQNLTKKPHLETELSGEFTISVGLSLEPKIAIVCDELANASMDVSAVAQMKGELSYTNEKETDPSIIHECQICIDGDISSVLELEFKMELLNSKKLKQKYTKVYTIKICDWYYSGDFQEFGLTTCPHCLYKTTITVRGLRNKISGAEVQVPLLVIEKDENGEEQLKQLSSVITDENGRVSGYLRRGKYTVTAVAQKYKKGTKKIRIDDEAKSVGILLFPELSGGGSAGEGDQPKPPVDNPGDGESVVTKRDSQTFSLGSSCSAGITEDGSLYVWGSNTLGHIENGTIEDLLIPTKIMGRVVSVSMEEGSVYGAITEDGSLYMWGDNVRGEVGNGTKDKVLFPTKVLDNVKSLNTGRNRNSAAITEDGSLYVWGRNSSGEVGNGGTEDVLTPTKIMEHVKSVSLGNACVGAITEDGSLYMWGSNYGGVIGNGTTENVLTPTKIMEHVKSICVTGTYSGAITEDGSLYMWGSNYGGVIGNGSLGEDVLIPTKIMSHVKTLNFGYDYHNGAITEDGSLYMWGKNGFGQIGNGSDNREHVSTPTKVLEHVKSLKLGLWHSAALTEDEDLYIWGYNSSGGVGNGTTDNALFPVKILGSISSFSVSYAHSGAVTTDGDLYMWGSNGNGEIGNGTTKNVLTPTKILENIKLSNIQTKNVTAKQDLPLSIKKLGTITPTGSLNEGSSKTASFTGLTPNAVYNFYALNSKTVDDLLDTSNLLYVTQAASGADGSLEVVYQTSRDSAEAEVFVVRAEAKPIASVNVNVQDLEYNNKLQYVHPIVTDQEKTLEEWEDYELCGAYCATDVGDYTVTIRGIGDYQGVTNVSYKITEPKSKRIERITLSVADASLHAGRTLQLRAEIFPEDAENKELEWSSSDPQVASVDPHGFVRAIHAGNAAITVKSQDGSGVSASCVITVTRGSGNSSGGSSSGGSSGGAVGEIPSGGMPGNIPSGSTGNESPEDKTDHVDNEELQVALLYYIVEFHANGGTKQSRKATTLLMDDSLGILPKVQRKKYAFKGWYTQKSGGEKVTQMHVLNASTTLYAQWKKIVKPGKPGNVSLTQKKGKKVKVKFKKVSGVGGYQIAYSTSKKFTASTTKKVATVSTEKILKNLKKGRTYYVRVRAYQMDSAGAKVFGLYSAAKRVKVKE